MKKTVYLDNAATTMPDPRVVEAMLPYMYDAYGNASGKYSLGFKARKAIEDAREKVARLIGAEPDEIFFTSGATEGNNTVLGKNIWKTLITSDTEHKSVLKATDVYKRNSRCFYAKTDGKCCIDIDSLKDRIEYFIKNQDVKDLSEDCYNGLVSIIRVNNETGTEQNIKALSDTAHEKGFLFHTDAVQAVGHIKIDVKKDGLDFLTASGHKFYGPKGIGFLYIRRGIKPYPLMYGGEQERGIHPGTENVPGIVGLGEACRIALAEMEEDALRVCSMSRLLKERLLKIPGSKQNGLGDRIFNVSFEGINGQSLAIRLDMEGICVSTGAACSSGLDERSHVLTAMGLGAYEIDSSIRISIGKYNTEEEIEFAAKKTESIVSELRELNGGYTVKD